jgi:hypothetical protein
MAQRRCGLCGRSADEADLMLLRGLKGAVCRPGHGCDKHHPALGALRQWLAGPDSSVSDIDIDDILVDNPKH